MGDRLNSGIQCQIDSRTIELAPYLGLPHTAENNLSGIKHVLASLLSPGHDSRLPPCV